MLRKSDSTRRCKCTNPRTARAEQWYKLPERERECESVCKLPERERERETESVRVCVNCVRERERERERDERRVDLTLPSVTCTIRQEGRSQSPALKSRHSGRVSSNCRETTVAVTLPYSVRSLCRSVTLTPQTHNVTHNDDGMLCLMNTGHSTGPSP